MRQWSNPEGRLVLFSLNGGGREMKLSNPVEFLQEHKYVAGYNIFWRFVAGLLDAESGVKETLRFFRTIEQEPFDLLGPTHQRLVMRCLSEVSNELQIRKDLLARLTHWLSFEVYLTRPYAVPTLPREPECPDEAILAALESVSDSGREDILRAVNKRLSDTTITALITLLRDDQETRFAAAAALKRQPNLSGQAIASLLALLEHEKEEVQFAAAEVLKNQSNLSDTAIASLLALLKHEQDTTRSAAGKALHNQWNLSDAAITSLLALLGHEQNTTRSAAGEALHKQWNLSDEAIASLSALLEHEQENVRFTAAKALPWRPDLSDTIITILIARLKHKEQQVRSVAAKVLGSQYHLSDAAIEALETLLQSKDYNDQIAAAEAFINGPHDLSDSAIASLIALLKDESSPARSAAANALRHQYRLSNTAIANLLALLEHEREEIRSVASRVLSGQIDLPDEAIKALTVLLQSKDYGVQAAAVNALPYNCNLPDTTIEALLIMAHSENSTAEISASAIWTLNSLENLPDEAVEYLMKAQFRRYDPSTANIVFSAWNRQSNLSNAAIESLIALFQAQELNAQAWTANTLAKQTNLVDKFLKILGLLLETEQPAELINSIFRNSQFLKLVYGILLHESFGSHISLYVRSDCGSCRCILNQPAGRRTASFEESGVADEFHELVRDCQKYWNKHGYKLWDSFGVDASQ